MQIESKDDNVKQYKPIPGTKSRFKPGTSGNLQGKPKGAISLKTKGWELLKETITTELTDKFMQEMSKLDGQQYINAYLNVLEFFRPRLSRTESKIENTNVEQVVINIPSSNDIPQFPDNFDEAEVIE
jgi:hypothetical protein